MLLIDEILAEDAESITCRGHIPESLATGGRASSLLGIELGAQAAAVHGALTRDAGDPEPRVGYLVAVVEARFQGPDLPAEQELAIRAFRDGGVNLLARYSITVSLDGQSSPSVAATISTMIAK